MIETKKARVLKSVGGLFSAELISGNDNDLCVNCRAKGTFRRNGIKPLPGDIVELEMQKDGGGFITSICDVPDRWKGI